MSIFGILSVYHITPVWCISQVKSNKNRRPRFRNHKRWFELEGPQPQQSYNREERRTQFNAKKPPCAPPRSAAIC